MYIISYSDVLATDQSLMPLRALPVTVATQSYLTLRTLNFARKLAMPVLGSVLILQLAILQPRQLPPNGCLQQVCLSFQIF